MSSEQGGGVRCNIRKRQLGKDNGHTEGKEGINVDLGAPQIRFAEYELQEVVDLSGEKGGERGKGETRGC